MKINVSKKNSGSITVEAAFIIPIITFLLFLIMYYTFFLHDRGKVEGNLQSIAVDGANLIKYEILEGNKIDRKRNILFYYLDIKLYEKSVIKNALSKELSKGLFIGTVEDVEVSTNISSLELSANLVFDLPFDGIFRFFHLGALKIPMKTSRTIFPREEITRILDIALRTGEDIKGVREGINKLVDLLSEIK